MDRSRASRLRPHLDEGDVIRGWMDGRCRVWLDTGEVDPVSGDPLIELMNGEAREPLGWVAEIFAPLVRLSSPGN
jgi:hypothetical protein